MPAPAVSPSPKLLGSTGRKMRASINGIVIEREFYVEPFDAHPEVINDLLGTVSKATGTWVRTPPAKDTYIQTCFCHEARVDLADRKVLCSSDKLDTDGAFTTMQQLETVHEKPAAGAAGGTIRAIYRPLITAYPVDEGGPGFPWLDRFDWLEPTFKPAFKSIPWPEGFHTVVPTDLGIFGKVTTYKTIPKDVAEPIRIPISEFTIRRTLVGVPPWALLESLAGTVNDGVFPDPGTPQLLRDNLPEFRPHTLRFDHAEVTNRMDATGKRWYDIVYHFSWINMYDEKIVTIQGAIKEGTVTWNMVFMRPWWLWRKFTPIDPPLAWYSVLREKSGGLIGLLTAGNIRINAGRLYKAADFMDLFNLNFTP